MKNEYIEAIENYEALLSRQHPLPDPSAYFKLLFEEMDWVQVKHRKNIHPADAQYIDGSQTADTLQGLQGQHSDSGIQFCTNAVPVAFLKKLDKILKLEMMCDPQWDRLVPYLRDELSLSANLFECGRTFFIEADDMPNGETVATVVHKIAVLRELLSTGLPISYILDTGGRGPHIGIVLDQSLSLSKFNDVVKCVMERLPPWIDCGVGRVNQLERMPNTTRVNKFGQVAPTTLIYCGRRVSRLELLDWIENQSVINPNVGKRVTLIERDWEHDVDLDIAEATAWEFIADNGLKSAKQVKNGKIQVSCPQFINHKGGKDRNMSAFISVESGLVWCSACNARVGRTFESTLRRAKTRSPLIPSHAESVAVSTIKPSKLF